MRKRTLRGEAFRFACLTHVDLHCPTRALSPSSSSSSLPEEGLLCRDEREVFRVDESLAQVLQVARLRPIRAWCSLSFLPLSRSSDPQDGALSLDSSSNTSSSSSGVGGRLSLLLNRETFARLGLPGEKTKTKKNKNKNKKRRRTTTTKEGGAALGQADQPLYEVHLSLHKQDDAASLARVMTVFSEPQSFLIESVNEASPRESTVSLRSALPTGCGGNESVHKRFERDVLFPRGLLERSIQRSQEGEAGVVDLDMFVALVSLQAQGARIPDPVMDSLGWRRGVSPMVPQTFGPEMAKLKLNVKASKTEGKLKEEQEELDILLIIFNKYYLFIEQFFCLYSLQLFLPNWSLAFSKAFSTVNTLG